jgi:hypothetical protein
MKKTIIMVLLVLTILNLSALLIPQLFGCYCLWPDGTRKCEGDCCGGTHQCDCYNIGTDNCKAAQ